MLICGKEIPEHQVWTHTFERSYMQFGLNACKGRNKKKLTAKRKTQMEIEGEHTTNTEAHTGKFKRYRCFQIE